MDSAFENVAMAMVDAWTQEAMVAHRVCSPARQKWQSCIGAIQQLDANVGQQSVNVFL